MAHQEVLSHSFICLPLPYMEGIVLICNIDLYCVTGIPHSLHVSGTNTFMSVSLKPKETT